MSGVNQNASSEYIDCNSCTNNGFWWSINNNNCAPYYNNASDINMTTINNGTALCPVATYPPTIGMSVPNNVLGELVGNDVEEKQTETLKAISVLQEMEGDYYNQLELGLANETLSSEQETMFMKNITEISALRINLYKQLNQTYEFYKHNLSSTQNTIQEQLMAINIVEEELKKSAAKLQILNEENNAKMRMVEINRYYGEKYADHTIFMKYFILFTILILFVYVLYKKYYITRNVYSILIIILIILIIIKMGSLFYRMIFRSNMDYQEYTFPVANLMTGSVQGGDISPSYSVNDPWVNNELTAISNCVGGITTATTTTTTPTTTTTST